MAQSIQKMQNDLGMLISTSGKLRMLSHRIVLFALLEAKGSDAASGARDVLNKATEEFNSILARLWGEDDSDIGNALALLEEQNAITIEHRDTLGKFLKKVELITDSSSARTTAHIQQIEQLAEFVSTELLEALNDLNGRIVSTLETLTNNRQEKERQAREMIGSSVTEIEKVSLSIRLIALNAAVEASRAGDNGRGFHVIANEVQRLSESTSALLSNLKVQLQKL